MKYLIIGAGGSGGNLGGFLIKSGFDVTFLLRKNRRDNVIKSGMDFKSSIKGDFHLDNIKTITKDSIEEKYDVIFICVKHYSLDDAIDVLRECSHKKTVVIPLLNGHGVGDNIFKSFKGAYVSDGCVYIVGYLDKDNRVVEESGIFRVVFGSRRDQEVPESIFLKIKEDLIKSGIEVLISNEIWKDTFKKFMFISAFASCGAYFKIEAKSMQEDGKIRDFFIALIKEMIDLGEKENIHFDEDIMKYNLDILDSLKSTSTSSLQRDLEKGNRSEVDALVLNVYKRGIAQGLKMENFKLLADYFSKFETKE